MNKLSIQLDVLDEINEKIDRLLTEQSHARNENTLGWLNNNQFCEALGISLRTAQNYRDQGLIPYSRLGGKVYYKVSDIKKLINANYNDK